MKLNSPTKTERMNNSTKVDSAEFLSTYNRMASPKSLTSISFNSNQKRFEYHDSEKLFKTHIRITNISSGNPSPSYNQKSNLFYNQPKSVTENNKSIGQRVNSELTKFRRYRRDKTANLDLDKYRSYSESKISKLNDGVSKYISDDITIDDFYKTLLKNNIDPESKQVSRIITELEKGGSSGNQVVGKFVKIKDISCEPDKLEKKVNPKPILQTKTSYELAPLPSSRNESKNFSKLSKSTSKKDGNTNFDSMSKIEDNLAMGNKKRKYDKTFGKHHNESENVISHPVGLKQIRSIKVESVKKGNEDEDYHKNKKINFMTNSQAFAVDKVPLDMENLAAKKYGSIMQNYTSKDQLTFYNHKNKKNKEETNIFYNLENKPNTKRDKNTTSNENLFAVSSSKEKQREILKSPEKIMGLHGKARSILNDSDVNQTKSSFNELIGWKVQKTKHDIAPTNKTGVNHDKSINEKKKPPIKNYDPSAFEPKKREHSGVRLFGHEITQTPKDSRKPKKKVVTSLIF